MRSASSFSSGLAAEADTAVNDIRSLRDEDRAALDATHVVARRDLVAAHVGLEAIEHHHETVRLALDGEGPSPSDAEAIPRKIKIRCHAWIDPPYCVT